jgi:FkbM family methyltransferase
MFTGMKIYLDPKDLSVTPHLALDGIYEGNISNAWLRVIRPDDVVFDIGANFGYFGVLAAQRTNKKSSKVVFFEANPHLLPYIRKTLAVNWLNEQSVIENVAVADKPGKVTLNVLKDYIGSSSLHSVEHLDAYMHNKMYIEAEEKIAVDAVTIDAYCKKQGIGSVNLIKMDIEGFEEKAYAGMRQVVKNSPELTFFIEFTKGSYDNPEKFYELLLKDFGHVYTIDAQGCIHRPADTSYEALIGVEDDWVMPIFSKDANLDKR